MAAGLWEKADEETADRMLAMMNRAEGGWRREEEIQQFPCQDLATIDRLWVDASGGQFGFSVQKRLYVEVGGTLDGHYPGDQVWEAFGDRVGWRQGESWIHYDDIQFTQDRPTGHLPVARISGGLWVGGVIGAWLLFSRVESCQL